MNILKIMLVVILLNGCSTLTTKLPEEPCSNKPIFKEYSFDKPIRPTLLSNSSSIENGEIVRNVEIDFINLIEYATSLENIVNAIPMKENEEAIIVK